MSGTPLRLLFAGSLPRWGGGGRWLVQAARGLAERGHDVHVVTPASSKLLARAAEAGLRAHALPASSWLAPRTLLRLRRLLGALRPDAVFLQRPREAEILAWCSWPGPPPPLFLRLSAEPLQAGALGRLFRRRHAARGFTGTRYGRQRILQAAYLPPDRLHVLRDGVPLAGAEPPPDRTALRRRLRLPRKGALVVHIGHLQPRKGQETSLRALATLRIWRPGGVPQLAFIGTGADESRLHDLDHELGVKEHVTWVGFRTNVGAYLQVADLLILPSRRPGVSWTLLEAMAHGVPVIAAAAGGVDELIDDGRNGLLVPADDPAALAAAMTRVLDDAALAARLAQNGLETVRDGWSEPEMLDELECMARSHVLRRLAAARALFVDRDDTLVRNVPYNSDPARVELVPGAARALRWVRDAGIPVVVVSNQSGVARGLHGEAEVEAVNARMRELLRADGAEVDAVYICPHHPEHGPPCDCRKPEPGLLLQAARELHIDLRRSLMVGNSRRDLEAGRRAGCASAALVPAGAGTDLEADAPAYTSWTALVRDFLAAAAAADAAIALAPPARAGDAAAAAFAGPVELFPAAPASDAAAPAAASELAAPEPPPGRSTRSE